MDYTSPTTIYFYDCCVYISTDKNVVGKYEHIRFVLHVREGRFTKGIFKCDEFEPVSIYDPSKENDERYRDLHVYYYEDIKEDTNNGFLGRIVLDGKVTDLFQHSNRNGGSSDEEVTFLITRKNQESSSLKIYVWDENHNFLNCLFNM